MLDARFPTSYIRHKHIQRLTTQSALWMFFLDFFVGLRLGFGIRLGFGQGLGLSLDFGFGQGLGLGSGLVNRRGLPRPSTFLRENRQRRTTKSGCLQVAAACKSLVDLVLSLAWISELRLKLDP